MLLHEVQKCENRSDSFLLRYVNYYVVDMVGKIEIGTEILSTFIFRNGCTYKIYVASQQQYLTLVGCVEHLL